MSFVWWTTWFSLHSISIHYEHFLFLFTFDFWRLLLLANKIWSWSLLATESLTVQFIVLSYQRHILNGAVVTRGQKFPDPPHKILILCLCSLHICIISVLEFKECPHNKYLTLDQEHTCVLVRFSSNKYDSQVILAPRCVSESVSKKHRKNYKCCPHHFLFKEKK